MAKKWERVDQVLVLKLYTELPFGHMDARNQNVKKLAELLGRTPGSVAMKLANYASLDETLDRKGLDGASKADRETWAEFIADVDGFFKMAEQLYSAATGEIQYETVEDTDQTGFQEGRTAVREVSVRLNQSAFRRMVLSAYDDKCALTGLGKKEMLVASHIIPWSAKDAVRMDPRNGICLNSLHDKAFDRGLISFRNDLQMMRSPHLNLPTRIEPLFEEGVRLQPKKFMPLPEYLEYHRDVCFQN